MTDAYDQVLAARSSAKISIQALIQGVFDDFYELHGDRYYGDDPAVIGGLARLNDQTVTVIGIQKGQTVAENQDRHFGCATPAGYRKALRLMRQAAQFHRPVITLINTPGAYPGVTAEYQGQGAALAECLLTGSQLPVPMISLIVGEGGSGGALALACGDQVWMLANSTYSILSPEGYASILWHDAHQARAAAAAMALTPSELKAAQVIDKIVPEVTDSASCESLKHQLVVTIKTLQQQTPTSLIAQRQARFRKF